MEGFENKERKERDEVFSKAVRAGKRTYFFDVKKTRGEDLYLTITESKKRFGEEGKFFFEKHKLFLYKEDFEKFSKGLSGVIEYIQTGKIPEDDYVEEVDGNSIELNDDFLDNKIKSDITFEELDNQ
ncbi:MAG: hypothetical protein A2X12_04445 [Bacteroidetes bacterium GWE2_29_8]|nr:MAG: hypothetical protein A2X12_04445 [Bacteroidetes bacterium GWE2_29_8]OFY18602.1 MAG: hypothetical protein A2X02_07445 [Bacteroidetes bacterium GWF2_29_10]